MLPHRELGHGIEEFPVVLDRIRLQMEHGAKEVKILRLSWPRLDGPFPGVLSIVDEQPGGLVKQAFVTSGLRLPGEMHSRSGLEEIDELIILVGQFQS